MHYAAARISELMRLRQQGARLSCVLGFRAQSENPAQKTEKYRRRA